MARVRTQEIRRKRKRQKETRKLQDKLKKSISPSEQERIIQKIKRVNPFIQIDLSK